MAAPILKTQFTCKNCGFDSPKWLGKCSSCGEWNSMVEERVQKDAKKLFSSGSALKKATPNNIHDIPDQPESRISTPDNELNRVLGGGIVPGSLVLLGGEPGIGKSTLLLQLALRIQNLKVLYVSGEESEQQIKMRAKRISTEQASPTNSCFLLCETSTINIIEQAEAILPGLIIIDSVQTLQSSLNDSSPGSISQVRESAGEFMRFAKESMIPVILIGHITKDGSIAGPKVLEHMVDTVIQFEGDRQHTYRILRTLKNRFGASSELGIYEMQGSGLREVSNPSEILLPNREEALSGISISVIMEGARALLIECQALVSASAYGTPQRSSIGFDGRRMSMLLAVLEKRCGFRLSAKDVFLNITGGLRVEDPAIDLGLMVAMISSMEDMPLPDSVCFSAEIGLSGELRSVNRIDQRISEAEKLGFKRIYISKYNKLSPSISGKKRSIEIILMGRIEEVVGHLFS